MMIGIWILWLTLFVLIIWGVKFFFDYTESNGTLMKKDKSSLDILRERYARGEIDRHQFEEQKRLLSQ